MLLQSLVASSEKETFHVPEIDGRKGKAKVLFVWGSRDNPRLPVRFMNCK